MNYSPWGHKSVGHNLATKQQQSSYLYINVCSSKMLKTSKPVSVVAIPVEWNNMYP